MGIKLGLVGLGAFGSVFAQLFASHPLVDSVILCDAEADKVEKHANDPAISPKTHTTNKSKRPSAQNIA